MEDMDGEVQDLLVETHRCTNMRNKDAMQLASLVEVGTPVLVKR